MNRKIFSLLLAITMIQAGSGCSKMADCVAHQQNETLITENTSSTPTDMSFNLTQDSSSDLLNTSNTTLSASYNPATVPTTPTNLNRIDSLNQSNTDIVEVLTNFTQSSPNGSTQLESNAKRRKSADFTSSSTMKKTKISFNEKQLEDLNSKFRWLTGDTFILGTPGIDWATYINTRNRLTVEFKLKDIIDKHLSLSDSKNNLLLLCKAEINRNLTTTKMEQLIRSKEPFAWPTRLNIISMETLDDIEHN